MNPGLRIEIKNKYICPSTNKHNIVLPAILEFEEMKNIILEFPNISF